jgi:hypothetical protein
MLKLPLNQAGNYVVKEILKNIQFVQNVNYSRDVSKLPNYQGTYERLKDSRRDKHPYLELMCELCDFCTGSVGCRHEFIMAF